jgi:dolichol-phosphate mannosyltransferase
MLSVIIPTYNEKDNVIPLLARLRAALTAVPFEVVFVDDSTDGTDQVISSCTRQDPRVRLIHRDGRRGLASAVVEGIRAARGDAFCVLDGDLQHPPEAIPRLLQALDDADIAIASRRIPGGGDAGLSPVRRLASYTATLLARALLPPVRGINDPMSGFFVCRKEVVEGVDQRPVGFKILLEVLARGAYRRVAEVPYVFQPRRAGATKLDLDAQVAFLHHLWALRRDRPAATSGRRSLPRWLVWGWPFACCSCRCTTPGTCRPGTTCSSIYRATTRPTRRSASSPTVPGPTAG